MAHTDITPDHLHEVVDRTFLLSTIFDQFILENAAVKLNPKLLRKAESISLALGECYQESGEVMWELLDEYDKEEQKGEQKA